MNQPMADHESPATYSDELRGARTQLARMIEPADRAGMALLHCLGPITLRDTITSHQRPPGWLLQKVQTAMATWGLRSKPADLGDRFEAWRSRLPVVDPDTDARHAHSWAHGW